MERRYRSYLLSRTCLLQATLFVLFGYLPSSHGEADRVFLCVRVCVCVISFAGASFVAFSAFNLAAITRPISVYAVFCS